MPLVSLGFCFGAGHYERKERRNEREGCCEVWILDGGFHCVDFGMKRGVCVTMFPSEMNVQSFSPCGDCTND